MPLIDDVKRICDRLAPLGWRERLLGATGNALDISQSTAAKLRAVLTTPFPTVDRSKKGFEDFHPTAAQAITRGQPGQSLLYHAFASPHVHPTANGAPSADGANYPTLEELDTIENFIYSLASDRTDLTDTVVAVFAYQYREASRTPHLRYADITFSRTGVARVGLAPRNYDAARRSFWVIPPGGGDAVAVLPARYGAFLARKAKPGAAGSVLGGHHEAVDNDFFFPLHKLFDGHECLQGKTLKVAFQEFHRNEKLHRTHRLPKAEGGLPVPPGFDISQAPYVRDSTNGGKLATLEPIGSSVLVVPTPGAALVRTVSQKNSVSNKKQLVHFIVPKTQKIRRRDTRFEQSSLEIPSFGDDRLAPEYVNIRHEIVPTGPITQTPKDLNALAPAAFNTAMADGGYAAAHFTDDSADGCVEAVVTGQASSTGNLPAFSLITAVDFFPLADQIKMDADPTIRQAAPLSNGRLPVNPFLPRPSSPTSFSFRRSDKTVTAVVGTAAIGPENMTAGRAERTVSFLPDAASNVFAPGWDTSLSRDAFGEYLTSYGLGSPFPEDAKLCAALSSFWPAVAPDNARTFGNDRANQLPMLDEELGFHPNHERVKSGELASYRGWDGEYGPFFEKAGAKEFVNFVAIERSDYVSNALAGFIRVSLTAEVQSDDLIARHQALDACMGIRAIKSSSDLCLVVVRRVDNWATFGKGHGDLQGGGFLLAFAEMKGDPKPTSEIPRVRREVRKHHLCQVGSNGMAYKNGNAKFIFIPK
jgi:hypothetical protein